MQCCIGLGTDSNHVLYYSMYVALTHGDGGRKLYIALIVGDDAFRIHRWQTIDGARPHDFTLHDVPTMTMTGSNLTQYQPPEDFDFQNPESDDDEDPDDTEDGPDESTDSDRPGPSGEREPNQPPISRYLRMTRSKVQRAK